MILTQCELRRSVGAHRRWALGLAAALCFAALAWSTQWDREGAKRAWDEAKRMQETIAGSPAPTREMYLRAILTFQQVYLKDPHYFNSDDAVYECARMYQKMGDKFGDSAYYRNAVKLYHFLVTDYDSSPFCPDALLQAGMLSAGPLGDAKASREDFTRLQVKFPASPAAASAAERAPSKLDPAVTDHAVPASEGAPPAANTEVLIKGINVSTVGDITRVNIITDGQARYTKERLSNPERVYYDIYNARLHNDLLYENFNVGDRFVKQVRIAQNQAETVRVVFDLVDPGPYSISETSEAFGITVSIRKGGSAQPPSGTKPPPAPQAANTEKAATAATVQDAAIKSADAGATDKAAGEKEKPKPAVPEKAAEPEKSAKDMGATAVATKDTITPILPPAAKEPPKTVAKDPPAAAGAGKDAVPVAAKELPKPVPALPVDKAPAPRSAQPTSSGNRTMTRMLGLKIGRIVLDPGHGGHDAGTTGPGGLTEKELVLGLAKELQKMLEDQLGATVILTRSDDRFVSLEERTQIANQHQADLFVSIHANSSTVRNVSGVETYFLDFARNDAAREIAARENASSDRNIRDLETLVQQIARADKTQESKELASNIQKNLYTGARKIIPDSQNRGVRSAPFVVLIGAHMPSVLAEVAFLSNPRVEKLLKKDETRQSLAAALFRGIQAYMTTLGSTLAQNHGNK